MWLLNVVHIAFRLQPPLCLMSACLKYNSKMAVFIYVRNAEQEQDNIAQKTTIPTYFLSWLELLLLESEGKVATDFCWQQKVAVVVETVGSSGKLLPALYLWPRHPHCLMCHYLCSNDQKAQQKELYDIRIVQIWWIDIDNWQKQVFYFHNFFSKNGLWQGDDNYWFFV